MHFFAFLVAPLLLASTTVASPTLIRFPHGSKTKRQAPAPSSYPGGDGPECINEFKYLNFDTNDATQLSHVQAVHHAFCAGLIQLMQAGNSDLGHSDEDITVYNRYFPAELEEQNKIASVYNALFDPFQVTARPLVADMILDNRDFFGRCPESGGDFPDDDSSEEAGYQGLDGVEKFHLCDIAYIFRSIPSDTDCTELSDHPDISFESLSRIIFHEMLHFPSVGVPIFNSQIVDMLNDDGDRAYYPQRAHGLADPNQDNNADAAVTNSDSYAWHATNSYFKFACRNVGQPGPNNGNFNDPPPYTSGDPGDR